MSQPAILASLMEFCRQHGSPCFEGWTDLKLRDYLEWHGFNHALWWTRFEGEIVGLAVGWRCHREMAEEGWRVHDPTGKCFYVAHLVTSKPGAARSLSLAWQNAFPDWKQLKLLMRRHKPQGHVLKEMPPRYARLLEIL